MHVIAQRFFPEVEMRGKPIASKDYYDAEGNQWWDENFSNLVLAEKSRFRAYSSVSGTE